MFGRCPHRECQDVGRTRSPAGDGSAAGRTDFAQFQAFYDFAFRRVHRFAQRRMDTEAQVEALTERILVSALISLGGVHTADNGPPRDPAETAFKLFAIARRVAGDFADDPSLLDTPSFVEE